MTDPRNMIGHILAQAIEITILSLAPPTRAVDISTILAGSRIIRNFAESYTTLMEERTMKYAFVRYEDDLGEEHGYRVYTRVKLARGLEAENPEAFIGLNGSDSVKILCWFEVPKSWLEVPNSWGEENDALPLVAILARDDIGETYGVSDLLATIFDEGCKEGYKLAQKKERELDAALKVLLESFNPHASDRSA